MAIGKCTNCGEYRELEEDEFDLESPLCHVCSAQLQAEIDAEKREVEELLDQAGPVASGPSLDLLNLPTPRDSWLKQMDYSREDHDHAMRNRRR